MPSRIATVYRDHKTGRFVTKKTWKQGGDRYKRERIEYPEPEEEEPGGGDVIPTEVSEWVVSFLYRESGRSFDVIVTATSEEEAAAVAKQFLKSDTNGRKIVKAHFSGWEQIIAKGEPTTAEVGEAEYRSESEQEE